MLSTTFLCAAASACSRSGLNLIDRHLYGVERRSVRATMVMNLLLPLCACVALSLSLRPGPELGAALLSFATLVPALMIQLVSYAYANAFKRSTLASVVVDSKVGELLIPLAVAPFSRALGPEDGLFYLLSFLAFTPMLRRHAEIGARVRRAHGLFVIGSTVLQAVVFCAFPPRPGSAAVGDLVVFHTGVLTWRLVLSVLVLVAQPRARAVSTSPLTFADVRLTVLRGGVFLATQVTFLLALAEPESHLAWPVLNATALISAVAAVPILKEKARAEEVVSLGLLTALVVLRAIV